MALVSAVSGFGRLSLQRLQQRVQIAASVRVLDQFNRRRDERDFIHVKVAAENVPEMVTNVHFRRGENRRLPFACTFKSRSTICLKGLKEMLLTVTFAFIALPRRGNTTSWMKAGFVTKKYATTIKMNNTTTRPVKNRSQRCALFSRRRYNKHRIGHKIIRFIRHIVPAGDDWRHPTRLFAKKLHLMDRRDRAKHSISFLTESPREIRNRGRKRK